jgi:hypothetical protein
VLGIVAEWRNDVAKGWVVAVEHSDGDLLYVVAEQSPKEAEDIIIRKLDLSNDNFVRIVRPVDDVVEEFGLQTGDIKGPM